MAAQPWEVATSRNEVAAGPRSAATSQESEGRGKNCRISAQARFAACLLISRPKLSAPPEAACMPYLHPQSGKHPLSGKRSSVSQESEGNPQGEVAARFWEAATSQ